MKTANKLVCLGMASALSLFSLIGCQETEKDVDFSNAQYIAELASLECSYHNVARFERASDNWLPFNIGEIGKKQMWFEYSGIVRFGVDAAKVKVSEPDADGVVTIAIPQAQVLGNLDVDIESMSDPVTSNGWFTDLTTDEKNRAFSEAQAKMLETASGDDALLYQARERAKTLLEQYVKNAGDAVGKTYSVVWEDAE